MSRVASDQLTIVLTLKDRATFTYRWMRYMNDLKCPYPILIADGGADLAVQADLEQPSRYPHLRYTYIRYPFDRDDATYYRKLADAVDRVTTPYVLLADNDDFILIDPIPQCVDFLNGHQAFVACGGKGIALRLLDLDQVPTDAAAAPPYRALMDERVVSIVADQGVERVCAFFLGKQLWLAWHYVLRTRAVRESAAVARGQDFHDPVTFELHMHLRLLLTGSYMTLDVPFLVKQGHREQLTAELEARATVFERFIVSNAFGELRQSLSSCSPALSAVDRARIEQALVQWIGRRAPVREVPREAASVAVANLVRRAVGRLRATWQVGPAGGPPLRLPHLEAYLLD